MKIGVLTFHASYNFGSNFQAYAFQKTISKLMNDTSIFEIINLRTENQKKLNMKESNTKIKTFIKKILFNKMLKRRSQNFEFFINKYLLLTKEYKSADLFRIEKNNYDCIITGSDQIWNLSAIDFEWLYYLDKVDVKYKVSYATSFGPVDREYSKDVKTKIKKLLKDYNYISVREEGSQKFLETIDRNIKSEINIDPVLLLTKKEWLGMISKERIIDQDYIFYYTLKPSISRIKYLKKISKKTGLKIVVATPAIKYEIFSGFIKKYDSGPIEFLNLLYYSNFVITTSFHGVVFSIILNKPFFALDGLNDNRIKNVLKMSKLENRAITLDDNIDNLIKNVKNINFDDATKNIELEIAKSEKYIKSILSLGEKNE